MRHLSPWSLAGVVLLAAVSAAAAPSGTAPNIAGAPAAAAVVSPSPGCGNGLLETAETCDTCPADCRALDCPSGARTLVTVELAPQSGVGKIGAAGILLAYRPTVLTLPGAAGEPAVTARVTARTPNTQLWIYDLGYGVRIGASNASALLAGPQFDVEFDGCAGAAAPTDADLSCRVESCAFGGGRLRDCTCSASVRRAPGSPAPRGE
jgi:hypothetical protein